MEFNIIKIIAIVSIIVYFLGAVKIDKTMKRNKIAQDIRLQVNYMLVLFAVIVSTLSGYIIFFTE